MESGKVGLREWAIELWSMATNLKGASSMRLNREVGIRQAYVAPEAPFMKSRLAGSAAGRIDLVLSQDGEATDWYGLEIQAVYFSGEGMAPELLVKAPTVQRWGGKLAVAVDRRFFEAVGGGRQP